MATPPEASAPASRPRVSRTLIVLAAAASIASAGAISFFALRGGPVEAAPSQEAAKPIFVTLEPLTVNLLSDGKPKFLHLGVSLKVSDERSQGRINEAMPELRSRLLLLLSNRDPLTLRSPAEKAALALEIRRELDRPANAGSPAYGISGVAFNAFVVQ